MKNSELMNSAIILNIISKKEKLLIAALCIWSFIHTYLLVKNNSGFEYVITNGKKALVINRKLVNPVDIFYPFTKDQNNDISNFDLKFYDYSEYFFYVAGAWLVYLLYKYLKK